MKYLHIEYVDGMMEHVDTTYGTVVVEDGVLQYKEKYNYRDTEKVKYGFPLNNIRSYYFSEAPNGERR